MDDGGSGEVLAQLLARVEQLEAANERLTAELRSTRGGEPVAALDEPVSRRGMLKKAGGALAAGVAGAGVVGALTSTPAAAADGQPVILGSYANTATQPTSFLNGADNTVHLASKGAGGYGALIRNYDFYGAGVVAYVYGEQGRALEGTTSGRADQTAVLADTRGGTGRGFGLRALTKGGTAVRAEATTGLALDVKGTTKFSLSGLAVISRGQQIKVVNASIREVSLVLATAQGEVAGTWVQSVHRQVANGRFIIHLNKPAPAELKVGWLVVN
jgi:hypothetical protein